MPEEEAEKARAGEEYDPVASGERLPGVYFAIASPPGVTPLEAYTLMNGLTKSWEHPLCYYGLAQAAGADTKAHEDIIERYGL